MVLNVEQIIGVNVVNVSHVIGWHWLNQMEDGANGNRNLTFVYSFHTLELNFVFSFYLRYGLCSRSCGGGVQSSTRDCNSPSPANGGKYCIGTRIKYRSCNTPECPIDTSDFREEQCAEQNNNNFDIDGLSKDVKWVPKYGQSPHDECKLFCRVVKTNNYFLLIDKVKDGTLCNQETFNKCVNGICREAGCDHQLDSDAKLDKCGVCNGNNSTCIDITGVFSPDQIEESKKYSKTPYYYYVVTIPKGASNIEILQPGYSDDMNYIGK